MTVIAPRNDAHVIEFLGNLSRAAKVRDHLEHIGRTVTLLKQQRSENLQARYDAAQTTDSNARYWRNADLLNADNANSPDVRRTLRSRSRYECHEGNSFAKGIIRTLANDTIGRGPRLQMRLRDANAKLNKAANDLIERSWEVWAKRVRLAKKLRVARKAACVDGESFIRLVTNRKLKHRIKLDLQVIECDRVCNPTGIDGPNEIDGKIYDDEGNVVEYKVLKYHPGGNSLSFEVEKVPAERMIHLFAEDRAEQHRGVPEMTTALPLFILMRDYTLAVLENARTVAKHTAVIETAANAVTEGEEPPYDPSVNPFDVVDIDRDMITSMPYGWHLKQLMTTQPATTYEMFRDALINEEARCINMPSNIAKGDSSKYNYASGRLDHQGYDLSIDVDRSDIEIEGLDLIFDEWFDEGVLAGVIPDGIGVFDDEVPHEWYWPNRGHVDPSKEATAQATKLASGTTHREREYKKVGLDVDEEDALAADSLGITVEQYREMILRRTFNVGNAPMGPAESVEAAARISDLEDRIEELETQLR